MKSGILGMNKLHQNLEKTLKLFILGWPLLLTAGVFAPTFATDENQEDALQTVSPVLLTPSHPILRMDLAKSVSSPQEFLDSLTAEKWVGLDGPLQTFPLVRETLSNSRDLQIFCFNRINNDQAAEETVWESLAAILKNPSLETAHLILGDLSVQEAQLLGAQLKQQTFTFQNLYLDIGDDLTGRKVSAILDGLDGNQSLTRLTFSTLYPTPQQFDLLGIPYFPSHIGPVGMERLVAYLEDHQQLTSYLLESQVPGSMPKAQLLKTLQIVKEHQSLQNIGLTIDVNDEVVDQALAAILSDQRQLEFLELGSNSPHISFNLELSVKALQESSLTALSLYGATFGSKTFKAFLEALRQSALTTLEIPVISLSNEQIMALGSVFPELSCGIETVRLSDRLVKDFQTSNAEALESFILQACSVTSSLKRVDFGAISLDIEGLKNQPVESQLPAFYESLLTQFFSLHLPDRVLNWATHAILQQKIPLTDALLEILAENYLATKNREEILNGVLLFNRICEEKGFSGLGHACLGTFCHTLGFYQDAANSFDDAVALNSDLYPHFFLMAGNSHLQIGNQDQSLWYYDRHVDTAPDVPQNLIIYLANHHKSRSLALNEQLQLEKPHLKRAAAYYERGLTSDTPYPVAYKDAAWVNYALCDWGKSAHYFTLYFENESTPDQTHYLIAAQAFFMNSENEKAVDYYEKGFQRLNELNITPSIFNYRSAATAYLQAGNFKKAVDYFQLILAAEPAPNDSMPRSQDHINLASAYLADKQPTLALDEYETVFRFKSDCSAAVYFSAAQAAIDLKQWDKVVKLYQTGLTQSDVETDKKELIAAYYNLGTAHYRLNNWAQVCPPFEAAIKLGSTAPARVFERAGYAKAQLWLESDKKNEDAFEQTLSYLSQALQGRWGEVINGNEQAFDAPLLALFEEAPEIKTKLNPL